MNVHGIDLAALSREGDSPITAVNRITDFLLRNNFYRIVSLAGHNVPFDVGFLKRLYRLAGENYEKKFSHRVLDTQTLALALDAVHRLNGLRSTGLTALCQRFGIFLRDSAKHDASEDAIATGKLLTKLLDMIKDPTIKAPELPPGTEAVSD